MQPKCFFGFFCLYVFTRLGQRLAIWNFLSLASMPNANRSWAKLTQDYFPHRKVRQIRRVWIRWLLRRIWWSRDCRRSRSWGWEDWSPRSHRGLCWSPRLLNQRRFFNCLDLKGFDRYTDDFTWFCCLLYLVHVGSSHHKVPHNRFVDPLKFL